jgi:hypothetical protein
MSRADKIAQRRAERQRWRRLHGYACIICGCELDDDDLWEDADPRQARPCMTHCGQELTAELLEELDLERVDLEPEP